MITALFLPEEYQKLVNSGIKFQTYSDFLPEITDTKAPEDNNGWIYVYRQNKYYKIGKSKYKDCRVKKYKTENPQGITLILKKHVRDYHWLEHHLHVTFNNRRYRGEWFILQHEDIDLIKQILKYCEI